MRRLLVALAVVVGLGAIAGCPAKSTSQTAHHPKKKRVATTDFGAIGSIQRGYATWYGGSLHGGPTASGERFNKFKMTAAHRKLPMNTRVRVTHAKTGRSVVVRINDRGPYGGKNRIIDLSEAAAKQLGIIDEGVAPVVVEVIGR